MSTSEDGSSILNTSKIFKSQEFMEFLAKQVDISKLTVVTKSGDKISASFNASVSGDNDGSVFKSLDAMKSLLSEDSVKQPPPESTVSLEYVKGPPHTGENFASKDWQVEYAPSHVDVSYEKCFSDSAQPKLPRPPLASALPPKKRAGKTDWFGMFDNALSPLVEAASRAEPQPVSEESEGIDAAISVNAVSSSAKPQTKHTKRKPRKVVPDVKEYVEQYNDKDVLFGRGGRSNHHPGNKIYRDLVTENQQYYKSCDKNEKTKVAQTIVDRINKEHKGRFLELCKLSSRYFIVPNIMARRKVGQALRENNTEEARAAKREKYGQGKPKKAPTTSVTGVLPPTLPSPAATTVNFAAAR